jgi:hypothetical protein
MVQLSPRLATVGFDSRQEKISLISILVTRQQLVLLLGVTALLLVGQLVTGTGVVVAFLFAAAILFGMLSVLAGGGLRSAFGFLNAILIGKFLLLGVAGKVLLLEPADGTLRAPQTTALVMAAGFLGLFIGTKVQSSFACPRYWSMNRPITNDMLLAFSIVLIALSYVGYFSAMIPSTHGEGIRTGGWLGIARAFGSLKSFAIVPPMLCLWRKNARLWMTHPAILTLLTWSAIVGIFSTSKEDALEPFVFYALVGFLRYGLRDIRLWSFVSASLIYYAVIVFPYAQYVRHNGGREGSFAQRAGVTKDTFWRIATDQNFRTATSERMSAPAYFAEPTLSAFNRLAMVGEADRLVDATERQQAFTGWETIAWGFKLLTPSFLLPGKPVLEAGNHLAHIVGDVGASDTTTQVSYGIMANFYNAFSLPGVLIGTSVFFAGFYYWIRLFLGDARWDGGPNTSALWFIWLVASFQHSVVESAVSGLIASLSFPVLLAMLWVAARWLSLFLLRKTVLA